MPDVEGGELLGSAIRAAQEGKSAGAWLRALRAVGAGIRRAVGLELYKIARGIAAEAGQEPARDLDRVPSLAEMPPSPTRNSSGVIQTVRLVYREKITGNLREVYHNTKSENGVSRQEAIDNAIQAYAAHSEEYQNTLVGAVHTSAIRLVPVTLTP